MNITNEALEMFDVDINQVASLILVCKDKSMEDIEDILKRLKDKGYVYKYYSNNSPALYVTSEKGAELLSNIDIYAKTKETKLDYLKVAAELRRIFPKGIKSGTNSRWVDGLALVAKRLKQFVIKYGEFPEEDIIDAAKRYVASFNGDFSRMRTLRYFIWADKRNPSTGEVEYTSDLLNYLEDEEDDNTNLMQDWETQLR